MFYVALYALAVKKFGGARFRGALRVTGYATAVTVAFGAIGVHKARAAVAEKGLEFGEDMASLSAMLQDGNTFRLNGQVVHTSTASSLEGVKTILDKYEANCKANVDGDVPVWNGLPERTEAAKNPKLAMFPILRQEQQTRGMIACFVPGKSNMQGPSARGLQDEIRVFQETGNIGAIGKFRYAYVKESPTGSSVTTVWTDEDFNVKALIPEGKNDAQGADPTVMSRPQDSQRLFSGTVDGLPYRVYAYRTTKDPKEALEAYDAEMIKSGWLSVSNPIFEGMPNRTGSEGHSYIHADKGVGGVVSAIKSPDGDTMIGVAEVTDGVIHAPTQPAKEADGF